MERREPEPDVLTVSFDITEGEVWFDPEGEAWIVKRIGGDEIYLERTITKFVAGSHKFVRTWRKLGTPRV